MSLPGLKDKTAIVTGAAGGIGAAIVRRLVAEGAKVVAVDLQRAGIEALAASQPKGSVLAVTADVSDEASTQNYVDAAVKEFGGVHLFANNAGIIGERAPLSEMSIPWFDKVMAVNTRGVFLGLRAVMRQMIKQGTGGSIVNTSSIGGIHPSRARSASYAASKAAVVGLSCTAALENGKHGIRVNAICPGGVDTDMASPDARAGTSAVLAAYPIPRVASTDEIANFTAYLLSDEASFQTGGVYPIDGGALLV